ncbi:lymphokine-activated killer T-cell-originated protein kinase-like [Bacillus rossius redtenbacheri]|uniref:lymphokine-activated killer T-cell-originated protein kinase-like n=1 Tax=Bacillus rossius redtenbacheri TaxID=93214 RepID=UPI002FDD30A4
MSSFGTPLTSKTIKFAIPPTPKLETLGYGTGVRVFELNRCVQDGTKHSPWAIKRVNSAAGSRLKSSCKERIAKEAKILKMLDHPNIVGFRAFVQADDGRECLAMEKCTVGLGDLILDRSEQGLGPFPVRDILTVGLCVSRALDYLHREKRILHGDIKSHNVLVKGDFKEVKLCDFGVSLPLNGYGNVPRREVYIGTELWSAPEVLRGDVITDKTDIFPFGLVLWEMMTLRMPHLPTDDSLSMDVSTVPCGQDSPRTCRSSSSCDGDSNLLCGTRPPLDRELLGEEYATVVEVFERCTEEDPSLRPSAEELVQWLQPHARS